ncbi:hypothetical protein EJ08DRAFT_69973 [Tothia fuscella]|uniref:Uncharacterized protein n=1 Tax=Tothia fuscella TaxID=1048955 RepID=A0A9P4TSW6_9PEZI|nr:hypothetical protein EJ08DRAFT_69973 [Tothia fuscella]
MTDRYPIFCCSNIQYDHGRVIEYNTNNDRQVTAQTPSVQQNAKLYTFIIWAIQHESSVAGGREPTRWDIPPHAGNVAPLHAPRPPGTPQWKVGQEFEELTDVGTAWYIQWNMWARSPTTSQMAGPELRFYKPVLVENKYQFEEIPLDLESLERESSKEDRDEVDFAVTCAGRDSGSTFGYIKLVRRGNV